MGEEEEDVHLVVAAGEEDDEEGEGRGYGRAAGLAAADGGGFDPTEDELVLHFLRPQLRGFPPRVAGAVVEADPCGAPPWDLLARHGMRDRGHFFAPRRRQRSSARRSIAGGAWMHSATKCGRSVSDLGVVVRWCRVKFCFYVRNAGGGGGGGHRSTGWIMEEYEITDPRCYRRDEDGEEDDYWVLCRVRKSTRTAATKPPPALAAAGVALPSPGSKDRRRMLAAGCRVAGELQPDPGAKAATARPRRA
ncbi:hypothetical protein ACP4OV_019434 [Aristida adscensionis]